MGIVSYTDSNGNQHFADDQSKAYQQHLKDTAAADAAQKAAEESEGLDSSGSEFPSEYSAPGFTGAVEKILEPVAADAELAANSPKSARKGKAESGSADAAVG